MPKFSINDKVSFINEKRDGVIKENLPGGICKVEIDDGFEIDALENELVLIRTTAPKEKALAQEKQITSERFVPVFTGNIPAITSGVWLVACPAEPGTVLTGSVSYYLVNNTSYSILYAFSAKSGKNLKGIVSGKLPSNLEVKVAEFKRQELIDIISWHVQLIFHKEKAFEPQHTVTKEPAVSYPDISTADSKLNFPYGFCKNDFIADANNANDETGYYFSNYSAKDIQEALTGNVGKSVRNEKAATKFSASSFEVDLHIEELTDNLRGLSNDDIINIQLNHFRKKLDEALYQKAYKIIFIHGVGNGKLKSAIRKELADHHLKFSDGAYERYGGGATEVIL